MHGLSIMQGLISAIAEDASEKGFLAVKRICVAVGDLSGLSGEELQFAYTLVARGAMFEGAVLEIKTEPNSREVRINFYDGC